MWFVSIEFHDWPLYLFLVHGVSDGLRVLASEFSPGRYLLDITHAVFKFILLYRTAGSGEFESCDLALNGRVSNGQPYRL